MKVICNETVVTGSPVLDKAGHVIAPGKEIYNPPGTEIELPDEEVPRLLKNGAVRLPDAPQAA